MISGKDKEFVPGKPFRYTPKEKYSAKGRFCAVCGRWKRNMYYAQASRYCIKCKDK